MGAEYHPEQPFSDPRVTVHVDDGRSFIRKSTDKYDLIIFALPDSLTLTSQFSSLRLESFLFTEEAFQEARAHLTPDGAMVLYNYYRDDWLIRKLAGMLQDAYGQPPYVRATAAGAAPACWSTDLACRRCSRSARSCPAVHRDPRPNARS